MPRSKRRIATDHAARGRCKELISRVSKTFTGKMGAASIAAQIQHKHLAKVEADTPMLRFLWRRGLETLVREALAGWGSVGGKGEDPPQLEMFAAEERPIVCRIGRARIWLPSRGEHVAYHGLSAAELRESGRYYIAHGRGEISTGERIMLLADMREQGREAA
jgi:hypothetical protein